MLKFGQYRPFKDVQNLELQIDKRDLRGGGKENKIDNRREPYQTTSPMNWTDAEVLNEQVPKNRAKAKDAP